DAADQVSVQRGALARVHLVIDERREQLARLVTCHGRNLSSLALRSRRARAISSYDSPSTSRSTTTILRSSGSAAMAWRSAVVTSSRSSPPPVSPAGTSSSASGLAREWRRSAEASRFRQSRDVIA